MERRTFTRLLGLSAAAIASPGFDSHYLLSRAGREASAAAIDRLRNEPPARAHIGVERGGPRLYVNGREVYPFLASSTHLYPTIKAFREAGIVLIHPILSLQTCVRPDHSYDWSLPEAFLGRLLELFPEAHFLPRVHLDTPEWWKDAHPEELLRYGLPTPEDRYDIIRKRNLPRSEGGLVFMAGQELREASFASELWRKDTGETLRHFCAHMDASPLASRIIGYHPTWGTSAEWNTYGEDYLPDYSAPMQRAAAPLPSAETRMRSSYGLLRDPEKEADVIRYYQRYHEQMGRTVVAMARVVKESTHRRILCGVFYGYVTEIPRIQEGGYQAAEMVLQSPDIDYIAAPYCYQPGNAVDDAGIRVTMVDDAGNRLGHPRGVGGDGGYRVPVESLRRRGKLFISEMDPSTYRDAVASSVVGGHGGMGSGTLEGSRRILQRDLGAAFANGVGGWLLDFGPLNRAPEGWYAGAPLIEEIRRLVDLGKRRMLQRIDSEADVCVLEDPESFHATAHWSAGKPWTNYGIKSTDYFNHWFLNTQSRAIHRIGAPSDVLYRFDVRPPDARRYRMMLFVNSFFLSPAEAQRIRSLLRDSGCLVVWYYAPGFIAPDRLNVRQMEELTGFRFSVLEDPGPMMIRCAEGFDAFPPAFGVDEKHYPRFVALNQDAEVLGRWSDGMGTAFAVREYEGHTSVYVGSAPVPATILRYLAQRAGVRLWSSHEDIVYAVHDAAMIVAAHAGMRTFTLPRPMMPAEGGAARVEHQLDLQYGDVRIFVAPDSAQ